MDINQLETPVAIVDLDKLEANITKLQHYLDEHGVANRPHIKTHKIPEIAHISVRPWIALTDGRISSFSQLDSCKKGQAFRYQWNSTD